MKTFDLYKRIYYPRSSGLERGGDSLDLNQEAVMKLAARYNRPGRTAFTKNSRTYLIDCFP